MTGAAAAAAAGAGGPTSLKVVLSPTTEVNGFSSAGGTVSVTTASVLASPSGGIAPYTYAWTRIDASAYTWTIGSAAAATTSFTGTNIPDGVATFATFRVTVTDAAGRKATADINAIVRNNAPFDDRGGLEDRHSLQ
jgi:hypothetical protein